MFITNSLLVLFDSNILYIFEHQREFQKYYLKMRKKVQAGMQKRKESQNQIELPARYNLNKILVITSKTYPIKWFKWFKVIT